MGIKHQILERAIPGSSTVKAPTETFTESWAFYSVGFLPDILKNTITMLLCMELILIRGQPPRQERSPRATLDRGEFT